MVSMTQRIACALRFTLAPNRLANPQKEPRKSGPEVTASGGSHPGLEGERRLAVRGCTVCQSALRTMLPD